MGYLDKWQLTMEEIDELLTDNPSLRSFMSGYTAEMKCRRLWFDVHSEVTNVMKYDDHDRTKKGDIAFDYKGDHFTVEVKSIQTNSIKTEKTGRRVSNFQCDASDRRTVRFPDGTEVETTCLLAGEFDILAVNLFSLYGEWRFVFAKNEDLPRVSGKRGKAKSYLPGQLDLLLATSMPMVDPPVAPYRDEPWSLLDELIEERRRGEALPEVKVQKKSAHDEEVLLAPDLDEGGD